VFELETKELGTAGKYAVITVQCECGRIAYAVVDRWSGIPRLTNKEGVISQLRDLETKEWREAERPRIRQVTRKLHYEVADELLNLIRKLSQLE